MKTINCNGHLIDLSSPKVMGILNITPDSFYDGNSYKNEKSILEQVHKMLIEGATFIDVGAYSSRPGADHISEEEERKRILPIIKLLQKHFDSILISVDTFRSKIASECINEGACIVNDISAGNLDKDMFTTIAKYNVPYIIMHMPGNPQTMQQQTSYKNLIKEITYYFSEKIRSLRDLQVNDIIIDVGFGFGKTIEQNYKLLNHLDYFQHLDVPILSGISRKSMLYKPLEISPKEALNATSAANTIALLNGSNILRVHDVKEAVECIKIISLLNNSNEKE